MVYYGIMLIEKALISIVLKAAVFINKTVKQAFLTEWFLIRQMFKLDTARGIAYRLITGAEYAIPIISAFLCRNGTNA